MKPPGNGRPTLSDLDLAADREPLPREARAFIREAARRIERFQRSSPVPGFVASDFAGAYRSLRAVATTVETPGRLFCEWGSGFGVVAGLAALLEFDAFGIEVEGELVDAARGLASDFGLDAEFARGSFVPGPGPAARGAGAYSWLTTEPGTAYEELWLGPEDFGVVYAYPWPDEEAVTAALFRDYGGPGAVLVTHHGAEKFRTRRRTGRRREGRTRPVG
jgi:hypothetical protein